MPDEPTTGVPDPDRPGHWLVPPWAESAPFPSVVRHFLRFHPWRTTNTAHLAAYFAGYRAALDKAPASERICAAYDRWAAGVRDYVDRRARRYQQLAPQRLGDLVGGEPVRAHVVEHGARGQLGLPARVDQ